MTEEQANEIATRLTIALMEAKQLAFDARSNRTPNETAQGIVSHLLAIRDALLVGGPDSKPRA